jgi:hypothetical protein
VAHGLDDAPLAGVGPQCRQAILDLIGVLVFLLPFCVVVWLWGFAYVQRAWMLREGSANPGGMPGLYILKTFILVFDVLAMLAALVLLGLITCVIITGINITGGLIMAMVYGNLTLLQAFEKYTVLTIGDGLVAQIPALADLERGGIVGAVTITGCVRESASPWFNGPFGFQLAEPVPLPFHPFKGQLKFFDVPGRW